MSHSSKKTTTPGTSSAGTLLATTLACSLAVTACGTEGPTSAPLDAPILTAAALPGSPAALRVMSRNVYLGGDVAPVLQVDFSDIVAVTNAAAHIWTTVQANNFASRAQALADEIEEADPHIVGLQEVVRFVTLDKTFQPTGVFDYIQHLEAALSARGLAYNVWVQDNTHVTLPIALDLSVPEVTEYLDFTDRIALLVRADLPSPVIAQGNYAAALTIAPGVTLKRGWIRVRSEFDGLPFYLVNTHLETQGLAPVQAGQTAELLGSITQGISGLTFVVGDLNSDAAAGPSAPSWTPTYDAMIGAGFFDLWTRANPNGKGGFTCCNLPDLSNGPGALVERIDFILVRNAPTTPSGKLKGSIHAEVVGDDGADQTPSGLWPSDHAGVVAGIRLPAGQPIN